MDKDEEFRTIKPPPLFQHLILPKINFSATHYSKMINIVHDGVGHFYFIPADFYGVAVRRKKVRLTVPPLLKKYTRQQIIGFIRKPLCTDFYCHSQPCERGVKTTTEACQSKMKYKLQLGQALMTEKSRKQYPEVIRKRLRPQE